MKKLLLTLAAVAGLGFAASADEVTYDFVNETYGMTRLSGSTSEYNADPQEIENGVITITVSGTNSSRLWADGLRLYKTASLEVSINDGTISAIEFTGKNATAAQGLDLAEGQPGTYTNAGAVNTWTGSAASIKFATNITTGNIAFSSIKVTYTGGTADTRLDAGMSFPEAKYTVELGQPFTAPVLTKATTAEVTYESDKEEVATVDENTGAITIVGAGTARITATAEANDQYKAGSASYLLTVTKPVVTAKAEVVTVMSDGKFFIVTPEGTAKNYTGSSAFGYLFLDTDAKAENGTVYASQDYFITFTATAKGYTMTDVRGKFLGMDATHWGSFNFYDSADAEGSNCYWDITFNGNDAKIENTGREGAYLSYKKYNDDWELATTDTADQPLVQLFKYVTSGVEAVGVENAEAPVEYFNLQGVRVANPENGLYIRRQGNTVTKVLVR